MKKNIVILGTGGTIAGTAYAPETPLHYKPAVVSVEVLTDQIPAIKSIANVTSEQIAQVKSPNMTQQIWLNLAKRINQLLASPKVDGVVVTHGTDTLEETAYFLNLVIKNVKPVVLVGAMRPADAMGTDGAFNLYNAIVLASSEDAIEKGVLVLLNGTINSSRDVTKTNTVQQDAFKALELGCLGYVQDNKPHFYRLPARKHTIKSEFDIEELRQLPTVEILYSYVDCNPQLIIAAVNAGAEGLVVAGMGNGSISDNLENVLADIGKSGIVIVRSTRVSSGIVTRNATINDDKHNFVVADTLNPQKARILLMLALTKTKDPVEIQRIFWDY